MKKIDVKAHSEEAWISAFNQIIEIKNEDVQFELKCTIADITNPEDVNDKTKNSCHSPIIYLLRFVSAKKEDNVRLKLLLKLDGPCSKEDYDSISQVVKRKIEEYDGGTELPADIVLLFDKIMINVELSRMGWVKAFSSIQPQKIYKIRWTLESASVNFVVTAGDADDVCNFRFYLPLHRYLKEKGVKTTITKNFSENFQFRFTSFFAFNDIIKKAEFNMASDILPIMTIGDKDIKTNVFATFIEIYDKNIFLEQAAKEKNKSHLNSFIDLYETVHTGTEEAYKQFLDRWVGVSKLKKEEKEFDKLWVDNKLLFSKWKNHNLNDNCGQLSCLIFLFMLRQYADDFESPLYIKKDVEDTSIKKEAEIVNKHFLRQLIADSKSYAEGLWQLIENAHEHSQGKVAFFGMRLHKARTDASVGVIAKMAQTRSNLAKSFFPGRTYQGNSFFNTKINNGERKYQDFLEIFVLDDAVDAPTGECKGVLDVLNEHQKDIKTPPETIEGIFGLSEEDYNENEGKKNYYIKHYGMRWLKHHVDKHDGVFMVYSPANDAKFKSIDACFYHNRISEEKAKKGWITAQAKGENRIPSEEFGRFASELPQNLFFTEYDILLPISHDRQGEYCKPTYFSVDGDYFEKIVNENYIYYQSDILNCIKAVTPKVGLNNLNCQKALFVKQLYEELIKQRKKVLDGGSDNTMVLWKFDLRKDNEDPTSINIEILAKALFLLVYDNAKVAKQLRIFIDFGEKDSARDIISEFIRLYSIFYLKSYKNKYMKNVQIALCSQSKDKRDQILTEINFILAGENLKSAYDTANKFVYYNAASSLDFVPLLSYLTNSNEKTSGSDSRENKSSEAVGIYPFELIVGLNEKASCWFIDYMKQRLKTEIRPNSQEKTDPFDGYGCKISNVRVRLGSKIHIDNFYEAELLFHNIGNIRRFAYLIAMHIFSSEKESEINKNDVIYVLGYENYSTPVVQEVVRLLKNWKFAQTIYWAMDTHTSGTYPVMDLMEQKKDIDSKAIKVYTIIPIGSTMSTVYKVHEAFKRGLRKIIKKSSTPDFKSDYVIVAVGDVFVEDKNDNVAEKYVSVEKESDDPTVWRIAKIKPQNKGDCDREIKFCLSAEAKWYDPQLERINYQSERAIEKARPLIHVDNTSTIINSTFPIKRQGKDEDNYYEQFANKENSVIEQRIDLLAPKVDSENVVHSFFRYGHIKRGNNHYQFYFDFKAIAHNCLSNDNNADLLDEVKGNIKNTEKLSIQGWAANRLATGIEKNAYNIVISPLSNTNAEFCKAILDNVFSSNFHFIHVDVNETDKEDFRTRYGYIADELKHIYAANIGVRFFFIDESVCTGKTLERASKLLGMLCNQSGIPVNELRTSSSGRPFDKVILLLNRSSYETAHQWVNNPVTDWVAYFHIAIPQYNMKNGSCPGCKVRDRYELLYKRSATNMMSDYFQFEKFNERTKEEYDQYLEEEIESHNSKYKEWFECFYNRVYDYKKINDINDMYLLINEEQFLRFKTMDRAYRELYHNGGRSIGENEAKILELLEESLKKGPNLFKKAHLKQYALIDCFISYLKVISRDYLAHIYDIRAAIYNVLHCIFILLVLPKKNNLPVALEELKNQTREPMTLYYIDQIEKEMEIKKDESKYYMIYNKIRNVNGNTIDSRLQYRIFKTVVHRLAMLHSDYIVKPEVIKMVSNAYKQMQKDEVDQSRFEEERVLKDYLASVKMASMAEDDDAMCVLLKQLSNTLDSGNKGEES